MKHTVNAVNNMKSSVGDRAKEIAEDFYACVKAREGAGTIARIAADRGGPSKGAIHNKTGDDYKGLIKAWAEHTGGVTRKVRQVSENPYSALIDKIENPALRAMMAGILAENRKMRREINLLKAEENRMIDMRTSPSSSRESIQILPASNGLYPSEIEALRHAVSEKTRKDEGWSFDPEGRVLSEAGRVVFKAGYVSAIQKVIGDGSPTKTLTASGEVD